MNDDPLTDSLAMRALHRHGFCWLFNDDGRPQVLYRRKHAKHHKDGKVTNELTVEWGNLESPFHTDDSRAALAGAWHDYRNWVMENQ